MSIDNGSDVHFMTNECYERLGLSSYEHRMHIKEINEVLTVVDKCVEAQISPTTDHLIQPSG